MEGAGMNARNQKQSSDSSVGGAVCVIDGDHGIRNSLHTLLGTLRVKAVTFSTAEEFLDQLNDEMPSFLITELALPGMSGFELKEALNRRGIQIPTIGLTGEADPRGWRKASQLGFLEVIEKPFVSWSVVRRIQEMSGVTC
jgi:FixJ family two-component response regulator